jgi:hypothetical protein
MFFCCIDVLLQDRKIVDHGALDQHHTVWSVGFFKTVSVITMQCNFQ